jgi:DNA-binding NtrC family response regulator
MLALLAREKYEVDEAKEPYEALTKLKDNSYELAVVDIRMPNMSGTDLVGAIKSAHPLVNIIIITGYSNMSYLVECVSKGAIDYFTKPLDDVGEFLHAIRETERRTNRWKKGIALR